MYKQDERFEEPEDASSKIFKYMDFPRFVSLLHRKSLYFCQPECLEDPFEGSLWPSRILNKSENHTALDFARKVKSFYPTIKVNCWHISNKESAAMWKLYSDPNAGIAIESTFANLQKSFASCKQEVRIGKVKYIDYDIEQFEEGHGDDLFTPFLYKRLSFEHEKELRAIIWDPEAKFETDERGGVYVPIDLEKLISKVLICPDMPKWIDEIIKSVLSKYEMDFEIGKSSLLTSPLY
jgi:hypothetical protein